VFNKMTKEKNNANGKIAVIRIRGLIGINHDINRTLNQLTLHKKNYCVVVPNNESNLGMIMKVKDYITWGNIDEDTYNFLTSEKGEEYKGRVTDRKKKVKYNKFLTVKDKKLKKFFRLNSPRKGYGRKGIKVSFSNGGALGYRGDKIKELIKRMI